MFNIKYSIGNNIDSRRYKLELNQKVDTKIIGMDLENKKIELSIKEVQGTNIEDELKDIEGVTFSSEG